MKEFLATSPGLTQKLNSYPSVLLTTPVIYTISAFPICTNLLFGSIPATPLPLRPSSPFFNKNWIASRLRIHQMSHLRVYYPMEILKDIGKGVKKALNAIASGKSVVEFINETTVRITALDALTLLKAVFG